MTPFLLLLTAAAHRPLYTVTSFDAYFEAGLKYGAGFTRMAWWLGLSGTVLKLYYYYFIPTTIRKAAFSYFSYHNIMPNEIPDDAQVSNVETEESDTEEINWDHLIVPLQVISAYYTIFTRDRMINMLTNIEEYIQEDLDSANINNFRPIINLIIPLLDKIINEPNDFDDDKKSNFRKIKTNIENKVAEIDNIVRQGGKTSRKSKTKKTKKNKNTKKTKKYYKLRNK